MSAHHNPFDTDDRFVAELEEECMVDPRFTYRNHHLYFCGFEGCDQFAATAGHLHNQEYCPAHAAVMMDKQHYYPALNEYQASRLLEALEQHPELSTGDWYGEIQILLRNIGVTTYAERGRG